MTITSRPETRTKRRAKATVPAEPPPQPQADSGDGPRTTALTPDEWPDMSHIVTEDDSPVDNIFSEKQQRLLTAPLYASWEGPGQARPFLALANVGLFFGINEPPLVPDAMLSLDVRAPDNLWPKMNRSYFVWVYGKPPEVVIEVVSNREGGEDDRKRTIYARIGVAYYAIFDPEQHLSDKVLRVYRLHSGVYRLASSGDMPNLGLGLRLWDGVYEKVEATWLRWHDQDGVPIPTGEERADAEQARADAERVRADEEQARADEARARADAEQARADAEQARADEEHARAERLATQLRAMGVEVDG